MRKPRSFDDPKAALDEVARTYRKNLWRDADAYVEVWVEKDALAGVILPVTRMYDIPLMVARGFTSETFAYEAIAARDGDPTPYFIYYLGDFDRAGQDAIASSLEKLERFADEAGVPVIFEQIAITQEQAETLPDLIAAHRKPKRKTAADRKWPYPYAVELARIMHQP